MLLALLGLRFVLELALFASIGMVGMQLSAGPLLGWAVAAGLAVVAVRIWGVFLAPGRRADLPLSPRVLVELVLFASAAWGLAWSGHAMLG